MAVIGVDIGGTKIRALLWDGKRALRAIEWPTPKNEQEFQKEFAAALFRLGGRSSPRGIGIGAAGIVAGTKLVSSPNIPYVKNLDFRRLLPGLKSLSLDNDARAFARGELLHGAGLGAKRLFALTIGTGIGRAYGKNGKIARIKRFEYPEPWEKRYQAVRDGDDEKALADFLGEKLSLLLRPFRPDLVVIGGGVMERRGFLRRLSAALRARGSRARVRRAAFRKNAVAIGAALLLSGQHGAPRRPRTGHFPPS